MGTHFGGCWHLICCLWRLWFFLTGQLARSPGLELTLFLVVVAHLCVDTPAAIGANIALVAAGCYIRLVNHALSTAFAGDTQLLSLRVLISTVMLMTVAMFGSKAWIDAKILQPTAAATAAAAAGASSSGGKAPKTKKKSKGSFSEGLAVLKNSPKIRNLALLVMSYGVGHR
jgi:ATP/ADP translocase